MHRILIVKAAFDLESSNPGWLFQLQNSFGEENRWGYAPKNDLPDLDVDNKSLLEGALAWLLFLKIITENDFKFLQSFVLHPDDKWGAVIVLSFSETERRPITIAFEGIGTLCLN